MARFTRCSHVHPVQLQQRELEQVTTRASAAPATGTRRRVSLRTPLTYMAVLVAGAAIGAAGGDALAIPLMVGLVAAGGGLLVTGSRSRPGERIDELGRRELIRARRVERHLTVASISLAPQRLRTDMQRLAVELGGALRETDLIGFAGGSRLLVVFTETSAPEARAAWTRLLAALDPALAGRLRIGFSSFPEENPTWHGLKALAIERERRHAVKGGAGALRAVANEA
jgi:hypothetical protein